jgi:hypothetical protein
MCPLEITYTMAAAISIRPVATAMRGATVVAFSL